jgi:hypothetical protein
MKTLREEIAERRQPKAAEASCIVASAPASTLIVSTWQGETWVLPWSQLSNARFGGAGGSTRLELTFPNHVVIVHGRRLRGLLDDLATFRLSLLRDFAPDYDRPVESGHPSVARIDVVECTGSPAESKISEPSH